MERGLGTKAGAALRPPEIDILAAHNARTPTLHKAQRKLGKLANRVRHAAHAAALYKLPHAASPSEPYNPLEGQET